MRTSDLPEVMRIQAECYPATTPELLDFQEPQEAFALRLRTCPDTAWVAHDDQGLLAYLMTYPSRVGNVTPLGGAFQVPDEPDCLYLHDLAVSLRGQGAGLGPRLVSAAWAAGKVRGLAQAALVSVQGSRSFWARMGFDVNHDVLSPRQLAQLQGYPGSAWYMTRDLA